MLNPFDFPYLDYDCYWSDSTRKYNEGRIYSPFELMLGLHKTSLNLKHYDLQNTIVSVLESFLYFR